GGGGGGGEGGGGGGGGGRPLPQVPRPDDADGGGLFEQALGEEEADDAEGGVEDYRQAEQHEQRAAVAEQVAHLAVADQADDGPAHAGSQLTRGCRNRPGAGRAPSRRRRSRRPRRAGPRR